MVDVCPALRKEFAHIKLTLSTCVEKSCLSVSIHMIYIYTRLYQMGRQLKSSFPCCVKKACLANHVDKVDWTTLCNKPVNHPYCQIIFFNHDCSEKCILLKLIIIQKLNIETNPVFLFLNDRNITILNKIKKDFCKCSVNIEGLLNMKTGNTPAI